VGRGTTDISESDSGEADPRPVPEENLDALVTVLNEVRAHPARSRADIVRATRLSRAVVSQRVQELMDRGLLELGEAGRSTGGRAPRLLRFRRAAGHVLVADLGATSIDVAITDLGGEVLAQHQEPADIALGPERVLARVEELFNEIVATTPAAPGQLWGIGIGVPGPVEFSTGRTVAPPIMPGWDDFPVRERFASAFEVPVWVDNDVNVMALGELRLGVARGHRTVLFIKLGTGIGAGVVVEGRLHRGAQGSAGDVGHIMVVDDPAVVCRCGKVGCLEALAGGAALARDGTAAARDGRSALLAERLGEHGSIEAADVALAASHGDPLCVELVRRAGHLVGAMLSTAVHLLNPSLIIVGGGVAAAGDPLLAAIREAVYGSSLPLATRELTIQRSALGHRAGVVGAALMVADQLFSRDLLGHWLEDSHPSAKLLHLSRQSQ
jgi:glucokinase-like ROK family protein